MMKITQFLTNVKLWQGIFVSVLLLVSLNLSAQNVGDDLLANSNGQVDTSSGWGGSGAGCFSWNPNGANGANYDGVTQCGWTSGAGLNYAPGNNSHGPTQSGDRMFKSYKTNGANGEFIAQEVGELALGTYTYSFFHRWTGGAVDYTEGAPKFTIKKANAEGGFDNVLVEDLAVGETGASGAWTETTGTWENTEGGQYKIQVYKNGAANAGLAQNLHLDTFSFVYTAAAVTPTECGDTVTYSQVANGDYTETVTAPAGQNASVTVNGNIENGWDFIYVTDGAGNALNTGQTTGILTDATFTSTDGTISVNIVNDGSVQNGDVTLAFACAEPPTECGDTITYTQVANGDYTESLTAPEGQNASVTVNGNIENGWDFIYVTDGAGNALNANQTTGIFTDATFTSTDGTISVNILNDGSVQNGDVSLAFTCAAATSSLMLQGIIDFSVPEASNNGKALHFYATADIADLSVYGVGVANNGGGTDGEEYNFDAISVSAGAHILLARSPDAMNNYMNASSIFDHVIEATSSISQNGNDAIELYYNGSIAEVFGDADVNPDTFGAGCGDDANCWDYEDAYAYKIDGEWSIAEVNCTDGSTTTCDSGCPYPFAICPVSDFPYCTTFDTDLGDWTSELVSGTGTYAQWMSFTQNYNGSVVPQNGAGMAFMYDNSSVSNLISSAMDISGVASPQLTFSYAQPSWAGDQDELRVWYKAAAGDDWTQLAEYTSSVTAWESVTLDLPNASSDYYIAFNGTAGYGYGITIDDVCVDAMPTEPGMEVSATTDGGSATFTFDITNFTVGAAAGEGDGHIHYSLNGGSEVMVYSTDPLTLSDLPNGDHTIVFSLVDANHAPLDPAVEATVEFSTFDGTAACDETITYTQVANGDYTVSLTAPEGQVASVTVNGDVENGWDYLYVTDGAGNALNADQSTGLFTDATFASTDGTISVNIVNDGSVQNGDVTLAFTCTTPQTAVTFSVNTVNIEVGPNGMYVGGGVLGDAMAYMMTDDDADGTYEVTVNLDQGLTGNYIFLNSPDDGGDWDAKEILDGQECADPNNWNDRILPEITGDAMTLLHCFGECSGNGTGECPAAVDTYEVTFSVDTSNYPGGLGESDAVYLNGNFNGWCGECNPMSDDDGDGIWTVTISLEDGDYEYKFTVNGWSSQEEFGAIGAVEGCTVSDGTYTNRSLTVAGEDMVLPTVYWNLCPGESPGEVYNITFNLDATGIEVGANGMYMGGGILGGANAVAMSDDDGDGIWTVTIEISTDQIGGNYTFLNSPNDGGDWDAKEDISGQECADAGNFNDRIVPEFSGDAEFCYVFAVCTDGVCADDPVTFPICEDFEGEDGAAGWTFIDAGGLETNWLLDTPANTGDQAIGHGYLPSDAAYNDWAVSPSYNTSGLAEGTATVSYYEYLNWSADAQAHNVYYTLDYAGDATTATWVLLTDVIGTDAEDVFVQRTFNIPSAESVVIGFQYLNTYGADWNIDDMCIDGTLSTTDTEILDMRIYPNPVDGNYVTIQTPIQGLMEIEVYTVTGRRVLQTVLTDDKLDVSSFNSGFYMVKVTINGQSKLSKLVVR